ncbi:DMT family transporter [Pseudomonas fluorescens]|uniref:Putative amino-acid metabolite efflux pump n=1 Tax=Pseudomonas fluorescens TaxID=294 RepID=A0A5E7FM01_PSEFL|nr:DMT family transporter [Pseudomonas fluorescens]VVO40265.1 putative amino-acid metabolite efflux pump [Pseudomonas fluorescens]
MSGCPPVKVVVAAMFVILCWAYSPIGIRIGLQAYEPGHLALLRFLIASAFMAIVALFMGISLPRLRDLTLLVILGFFAVSLHHLALNFGQRGVSAGAASVLAQSTPLFSTLLAHFIFKDRVSPWRWACVLLGMLGAIVVVTGDHGFGSVDAHGLLILLAALSWSIYFTLQKRHSHRYNGLTLVCYTVWSGTALLLIYLPGLASEIARAPMKVDLAVVILGIFPSALAYLAWAYVLTHLDLTRASMMLYLIPPTAMLMAAFVLGERPSMLVVLGATIILVSVLALNLERERLAVSVGRT